VRQTYTKFIHTSGAKQIVLIFITVQKLQQCRYHREGVIYPQYPFAGVCRSS